MIFTPFYLPLVGIALLLTFSFIKEAPTDYKLMLLAIVYILTVFMPTILIFIYRLFRGWSLQELGQKHHRIVPYAISIACYLGCIWVMYYLHVVYLVIDIISAALLIQAISVIVNFFWKISTHAAAIGGVSGALVGFGFDPMLHFYPLLWLCLSILVAGIVGTSRIILRQHSTAQVVTGYFVGLVTAFLVTASNYLINIFST